MIYDAKEFQLSQLWLIDLMPLRQSFTSAGMETEIQDMALYPARQALPKGWHNR